MMILFWLSQLAELSFFSIVDTNLEELIEVANSRDSLATFFFSLPLNFLSKDILGEDI
jgi:hypothetical protein